MDAAANFSVDGFILIQDLKRLSGAGVSGAMQRAEKLQALKDENADLEMRLAAMVQRNAMLKSVLAMKCEKNKARRYLRKTFILCSFIVATLR